MTLPPIRPPVQVPPVQVPPVQVQTPPPVQVQTPPPVQVQTAIWDDAADEVQTPSTQVVVTLTTATGLNNAHMPNGSNGSNSASDWDSQQQPIPQMNGPRTYNEIQDSNAAWMQLAADMRELLYREREFHRA